MVLDISPLKIFHGAIGKFQNACYKLALKSPLSQLLKAKRLRATSFWSC